MFLCVCVRWLEGVTWRKLNRQVLIYDHNLSWIHSVSVDTDYVKRIGNSVSAIASEKAKAQKVSIALYRIC